MPEPTALRRDDFGLTSMLARLCAFCEADQLPISDLVQFWRKTYPTDSRVGLFAAPGSGAARLFASLTRINLEEKQLQRWIYEAGHLPSAQALLLPDGSICDLTDGAASEVDEATDTPIAVRVINHSARHKTLVSIALCGTIPLNAARLLPADWLERVAIAIIVTPATAVLGKLEVDLMRRLSNRKRKFAVVILGLEGEALGECDAFIQEIEDFKLRPLRKELGPFYTLYEEPDIPTSIEQLSAKLHSWIQLHIEIEKARQLAHVVSEWLVDLEAVMSQRLAADQKEAHRLHYMAIHLREHLARLADIVFQECLAAGNRLHAQYDSLSEACAKAAHDFSVWTPHHQRNWRDCFSQVGPLCQQLENDLHHAPRNIAERIAQHFAAEMEEFYSAYADVLQGDNFRSIELDLAHFELPRLRANISDTRRVQASIEKKALQLLSRLYPESPSPNPPESENDDQRSNSNRPILDLATRPFMKTRPQPQQVEIEMRDSMLSFLEGNLQAALGQTVTLISNEVARELTAEFQKVIIRFERQICSRAESRKEGLIWANRQSDFRKLQEEWNELTAAFTTR